MRPIGCACGCGKFAYVRGLSQVCYNAAAARVKAGETTWAELEAEGKARPPRTAAARRAWFNATRFGARKGG